LAASSNLCILLTAEQVVNKTRAALLYLRDLFPLKKFDHRLPPIILQHQLYSIVTNRGLVDMQLVSLSSELDIIANHYRHCYMHILVENAFLKILMVFQPVFVHIKFVLLVCRRTSNGSERPHHTCCILQLTFSISTGHALVCSRLFFGISRLLSNTPISHHKQLLHPFFSVTVMTDTHTDHTTSVTISCLLCCT